MTRWILNKSAVVGRHFNVMGYWNAINYIIQRIYKRDKLLIARIKNTDLKIFLRNDKYDTQIFTQIFIRAELNVDFELEPKIILDGGANIGLATLYLKNKYPHAKIIAVEPEQSNFELLIKNTKNYKDVFCLQNGIWNKNGRLEIIDNGDGNASFITKELNVNDRSKQVISAVTIDEIMKQFGIEEIDLLKLDIEGSEKEVFEKDFEIWLPKIKHIMVEIHPHLHPDCESIVSATLANGFNRMQVGEYSFFKKIA
jgi:FkbM family methyltransferase